MRIYSYFFDDDIVGGVYIIDEEKHKDADESGCRQGYEAWEP